LSIFVDSSVWFAAAVARDRHNGRAKSILRNNSGPMTTDHVLAETRLLLKSRYHREGAERFWERIRRGGVRVEIVVAADLEAGWAMGEAFPDQEFSIVDRTSFAVMEGWVSREWRASMTILPSTGTAACATGHSTSFGNPRLDWHKTCGQRLRVARHVASRLEFTPMR
jgi:predicted nucleic acid-binding protein